MRLIGVSTSKTWAFHPYDEGEVRGRVFYFWLGPLVFEFWVGRRR